MNKTNQAARQHTSAVYTMDRKSEIPERKPDLLSGTARTRSAFPGVSRAADFIEPSAPHSGAPRRARMMHDMQQTAGNQRVNRILGETVQPKPIERNVATQIQRKVEMHDLSQREQAGSGYACLPKLIARLNAISKGLFFKMKGQELGYDLLQPENTLSNFEKQMIGFIDKAPVIPLRLANRKDREWYPNRNLPHGGSYGGIEGDDWHSGKVDIDDLLAGDDLSLQLILVHFLQERMATPNYAHRIGSQSLYAYDPVIRAVNPEFVRAHEQGRQAELQLFRDFFGDNTIEIVKDNERLNLRHYRGRRRHDDIYVDLNPRNGVDRVSVEVVTQNGNAYTPEAYKALHGKRGRNPSH